MDSKYIIVYSNNIKDKLFIDKIYNKFKLKIYIFRYYFNQHYAEDVEDAEDTEDTEDDNDQKNNSENYEIIYIDNYIEELYIKDAEYIFYLNNSKITDYLTNLLAEYNKNNIFYKLNENIINKIKEDIEEIEDFKEYLENLENLENLEELEELEELEIKNNKININLLVNRQNINIKQGIVIITYFKKSDIKILDIIQKKCIFENFKNPNIDKIIIIGDNIQEEFKTVAETNNVNNFENMMFYQSDKNISFVDLVNTSNQLFPDRIICIVRSDIILLNQSNLNDIEIDLISDENQIFALSRTERLINGNLVKCEKLNGSLYSTEQDAWIFKSPLKLYIDNLDNSNNLDNIYFYNKYSHLFFNKILKNNNYNIINNSKKYKIIRILHENNLDSRLLFDNSNNQITDLNSIYLLPDNEILDRISFEQLLKLVQVDENELYKLKSEIFDKYFKNKIFRN